MTANRFLDSALDASVVLGYTRLGYRARSGGWNGLPAMDGKTVVITGATGGLGRTTTLTLASLGARVVAVGRSEAKLDALADAGDLRGEIVPMRADLSLLAEIRRLAGELLDTEDRIDVLINNVGVLFVERSVTAEGIESSLATNLLGQFLLTNLLAPRLVRSAPARIVTVSSGGMYTQGIELDDLEFAGEAWNGSKAYARTKRGQVILSELWADKLAGTGVVAHSMHPGWADTQGVKDSLPAFRTITAPLLRTPEQGADTIVWLTASDEAAESSGRFWHDRRARPTHRSRRTRSTEVERLALWDALAARSGWEGDLAVPG